MKPIQAKKSLGQNFLIDEEALHDISMAIPISQKHIIEVGPGYGALTSYILGHAPKTLDLIELDRDMIAILDERFMGEEKTPIIETSPLSLIDPSPIAIHHQDVLTYIPPYTSYSIIANIPYYITSPILFYFLYPETSFTKGDVTKGQGDFSLGPNPPLPSSARSLPSRFHAPQEMVIMMQEEVGEKILAGSAKKPHHSYFSLAMELACEDIEIVRYVGRASFDPAPKVDSIVLKFTVKSLRDRVLEEKLLSLWRIAFTHPRKTLISNLKGGHYDIEGVKKWIIECGYDEKVRAEAVGMEEWKKLIQ